MCRPRPAGQNAGDPCSGADDAGVADGPTAGFEAGAEMPPPALPLAEGATRVSYVVADVYSVGEAIVSTLSAAFYDTSSGLVQQRERMGPCVVTTTTFSEDRGFDLDYYGAGKIELVGGPVGAAIVQSGAGYYNHWDHDVALWQGGETLTVSAAGGQIRAWSVELEAPGHVDVQEPVPGVGEDLLVDRARDLTFVWRGTPQGEVEIRISGPQQLPAPQTTLACRFAAVAGRGAVPAQALRRIVLAGRGSAALEVVSERILEVPGWGNVAVRATAAGLRPWLGRYLVGLEFRGGTSTDRR